MDYSRTLTVLAIHVLKKVAIYYADHGVDEDTRTHAKTFLQVLDAPAEYRPRGKDPVTFTFYDLCTRQTGQYKFKDLQRRKAPVGIACSKVCAIVSAVTTMLHAECRRK
jgi:hypothetical protein